MSPEPEEKPTGDEEAAAEPTTMGVPLTLAGLEELNIERDSPVGIMIMCVNSNPTIIKLDIRRCSFPPEIEEVLTTMVKHKELRGRGGGCGRADDVRCPSHLGRLGGVEHR